MANRNPVFLAAGAILATAGCATFSTVSLLENGFKTAVVTRSITIFPPGSDQKVTAFVLWNPAGGNVDQITRDSSGVLTQTVVFKAGTDFQPAGPLFTDASVSAGVKYKYTLKVGSATRVNTVEPVASVADSSRLTSPGIGALEYNTTPGASESVAATVDGGKPQFQWGPMPGKDASQSYGFYLICGQVDKSTQFGVKPFYSAFLEEASHSAGVAYGTKSDLTGFSTELLDYMSKVPTLKDFAPVDTDKAGLRPQLPKGDYAWTVLTVNSDSRHISFGIGKPSAPTDAKHFRFFRVP